DVRRLPGEVRQVFLELLPEGLQLVLLVGRVDDELVLGRRRRPGRRGHEQDESQHHRKQRAHGRGSFRLELQDGDAVSSDQGAEERSEEHTSELQSRGHLVCRLLLEKKKKKNYTI